ncbi:MAG: lipopolysaccharide biosynthesis protein [Thermoleophilaceae bacterium]
MTSGREGTPRAVDPDEGRASAQSEAERATTGSTVMAGGVWSTASRIVPQLYTLVISVAAARYLGPDGMGRQSFISFAAISLTTLLTSGLSQAFARYTAVARGEGRPAMVRSLVAWMWRMELIGALLGAAILIGVALGGADPQAAWVLAGIASAFGVLQAVPATLLMGAQRWRGMSVAGLVTGAGSTAAMIAVLAAGGGITGMFAVEAGTVLVNLGWTGTLARRALREIAPGDLPTVPVSRPLRREIGRYAAYSWIIVVVALVVWQRSEFLFLDHYSSDAEIALYSIAFAATNALVLVARALGEVIGPAFATLYGAGAIDRIRSGYGRALRLMTLTSLPLTAGVIALGPPAVRLFYGSPYQGVGTPLVIMASVLPIIPLRNASNALLSAFGRVRLQVGIGLFATVVNLLADFLLIPAHGAIGAAIANALAQATASLAILAFGIGLVGRLRWEAAALLRTAVASAAAGAVSWAVVSGLGDTAGVPLGLLAGALVFAALAALLRILPAEDGLWLQELAGGRLGGRLRPAFRLCTALPARSTRG